MRQVNMHQAKTQLSSLVDQAAKGEAIIIAKAGKPVAQLIAIPKREVKRKPGKLKGNIWMAADFDAPLSARELTLWQKGKLFP